jgi:Fe-S-cluster-containing dehydrogenase component
VFNMGDCMVVVSGGCMAACMEMRGPSPTMVWRRDLVTHETHGKVTGPSARFPCHRCSTRFCLHSSPITALSPRGGCIQLRHPPHPLIAAAMHAPQ